MRHINAVAIRKCGIEGFTPYAYERLGGTQDIISGKAADIMITLGKERILTRGPRKGQKTWDTKDSVRVVVTYDEAKAERQRYEAETGNCGECFGTGQEWCVWSAAEGNRHRQCRVCLGTGKVTGASK